MFSHDMWWSIYRVTHWAGEYHEGEVKANAAWIYLAVINTISQAVCIDVHIYTFYLTAYANSGRNSQPNLFLQGY